MEVYQIPLFAAAVVHQIIYCVDGEQIGGPPGRISSHDIMSNGHCKKILASLAL